MPLDVARLRDSGMASDETPEVCWAAVLLWAAAWHQVPAGSIPDNEQWIAKQAGYAQRGRISEDWTAVRDGALRNFVMCADGRLYHPVVAEKAREAWKAKLLQRWRTECARIKKHNDRHPGANVPRPSHEEWLSMGCPAGQPLHVPKDIPHPEKGQGGNVSGETLSKGQGEGQGQGDLYSVPKGTEGNPPPAAPAPPAKPKTPEEMAKAELWRAAVSVLEHGGCPASQCRTFMGKLVQDYDFAVVQQAVANAVTAQPADAREYLRAACMRIKGERPNKQQAMEQRGMTTAKTWAKGGRNA
ncbi:DUF1376 domain-containing protein [Paracidovorax avenae]|nr:DUF1376 domain-containing protein [Paracidovorax avenae]